MKKKIVIFVSILVGLFVFLTLFKEAGDFLQEKFPRPEHGNFFQKNDRERVDDKLPSCGDKQVLFTHALVEPDDFLSIVPLGLLSPSSHVFPTKHIYFFANWVNSNGPDMGTKQVPVYAPGDIIITFIKKCENFIQRFV